MTSATHTFLPTEPIPVIANRPPWRETFSSLRVPNFRLYVSGQVIATTALGMQRVTQDWLVLQLSGSVAAVGITVAMQFAPMLFFGLMGGVIADRHSKRRLLIITQSTAAAIAAMLAVLVLTGGIQVWHIWALAFVLGLVTVIDNPARQVFVNEIVGPRNIRNAISVNSSTFQLGSLIGPALGGIAITAVGSGWAFAINSAACVVVVCTIVAMNPARLLRIPPMPRSKGQLVQGLRYAARKPAILWTLVVLSAVTMFAFNMPVLLAAYADNVFHVGAGGYGLFNAMVAAGALGGAMASARRVRFGLRTTILGAAVLGLIQGAAGFVPAIAPFTIMIVAAGAASLLFFTAANTLVQISSNLSIRGRVMALFILVQLGGQAIGGPIMGGLVEAFGANAGMVISGAVPLVVACVAGAILAHKNHLTVGIRAGSRMRRLAIVPRNDAHAQH
ncbi:MFS transporter [Rathayibacter soli]|uniref:MFS transporter n=1 Tax=Rathayibacter soli TaxID=3144168 RepID=UPI0027E4A57F|nr:MFS transporter [Glaciibacter superstes]